MDLSNPFTSPLPRSFGGSSSTSTYFAARGLSRFSFISVMLRLNQNACKLDEFLSIIPCFISSSESVNRDKVTNHYTSKTFGLFTFAHQNECYTLCDWLLPTVCQSMDIWTTSKKRKKRSLRCLHDDTKFRESFHLFFERRKKWRRKLFWAT